VYDIKTLCDVVDAVLRTLALGDGSPKILSSILSIPHSTMVGVHLLLNLTDKILSHDLPSTNQWLFPYLEIQI
jgi:hypothetical protein